MRSYDQTCLNLRDCKAVRGFVRNDDPKAIARLEQFAEVDESLQLCRTPSMGCIVVHPVTAVMSTQAVNHFTTLRHRATLV